MIPRVLVEDINQDAAVVAAVDRGPEDSLGVAADLASEDDLHVVRPADVEVVGDQRLEEAAGMARGIEHDGAGDLHLPHRGLPPVAGIMVLQADRQWQPVQPPLDEHVDGPGAEPVTDRLQRGGVLAGGEPVGQRGETDPGPLGLPLGPLMPVYLLTQILAGYGNQAHTLMKAGPKSWSQR